MLVAADEGCHCTWDDLQISPSRYAPQPASSHARATPCARSYQLTACSNMLAAPHHHHHPPHPLGHLRVVVWVVPGLEVDEALVVKEVPHALQAQHVARHQLAGHSQGQAPGGALPAQQAGRQAGRQGLSCWAWACRAC